VVASLPIWVELRSESAVEVMRRLGGGDAGELRALSAPMAVASRVEKLVA